MKYGIEFHLGGGLFSHYLIILANLDKWLESGRIKITDELYFDSRYDTGKNLKTLPKERNGMSGSDYNIFDHIFEQDSNGIDGTIITEDTHIVLSMGGLSDIKERYQYITENMLRINNNILEKVNLFMENNFKENMLGIHVRMTDMNLYASGHNSIVINDNDYFNKIDEILLKESIDKIFVASDNVEMIDKLSTRYDICYYDMECREESEKTNKDYWFKNWFPSGEWNDWRPEFYTESMIDSILLSHCDVLIARKSALNYSSNTYEWSKIKNYYSLEE
tara:strand:- start:60065 stop:60898 length:834 start_codon:yes stop_codon:yes gene_type:complete